MFSYGPLRLRGRVISKTEVPLQESDRVYCSAACGQRYDLGAPGASRPWARCASGRPTRPRGRSRGALSTAAGAGPGYPRPLASPQTPEAPFPQQQTAPAPLEREGAPQACALRARPPEAVGGRGWESPEHRPRRNGVRPRRPAPSATRAGLDPLRCGRGGGPVPKQVSGSGGTAGRGPSPRGSAMLPRSWWGRPSLERTEALKQRASRRHAAGEGSGLVRVLPGRHSGRLSHLPPPAQEQLRPHGPSRLDPCVWLPLGRGWCEGWYGGARRSLPSGRCPGLETTGSKWVTPQRQS